MGSAGTPTCNEYARTGSVMFFSWVGPKSVTVRSSLPLTCRYASSERQIAPGPRSLQSRGNVHPIAHQVAVAFLDHIAEVNADPEDDAAVLGHAGLRSTMAF